MDFFAVVTEGDLDQGNTVRLVNRAADPIVLEKTKDYDPMASYPAYYKASFDITRIKPITLTSTYNGQAVPAQICGFKRIAGFA